MHITWDEVKAETNLKKHGIDFLEAVTVLRDPMGLTFEDESGDEQRFITIGHSSRLNLLVVVTCSRGESEIRIISARKASRKERMTYEEGI